MDWIKVLNRHVLVEYTDLRESEFVAWIKIMALTAALEHEPTRDQMLKYVHYKTLDSLQYKLNKHSIDLQYIFNKVLIDVQYVTNRRELWKNKKRKNRGVDENVPGEVSKDVSYKRREDKDIDKEKNKKIAVDIPIWIEKKTWDAFIEIRKKLKAPNTDHALRLITAKLEKLKLQGYDPHEVLNESISNGWRGVFPLKTTGRGARDGGGGSRVQTTPPEWKPNDPVSDEQAQENIKRVKALIGGIIKD